MSKLTIIADSTALALYDECPMKWNLEVKEGLEPILHGINEPMLMGEYGHSLLQIKYKMQAQGYNLQNAIEAAAAYDPDSQVKPFALSRDRRAEVFNRFREYCYTYINNDFVANSPESVEVGFSEPIFESSDRLYVLEGRLDLKGTFAGLHCIVDHKFQMRMRELHRKMIQFKNYAMINKMNMLIINYIRLTKKVDTTTFVRDVASFTPAAHEVWHRRLIGIYNRMAESLLHDSYEQRWSSCSGKFGYGCNFSDICEQWDHSVIDNLKKTQFQKKEEWKPW